MSFVIWIVVGGLVGWLAGRFEGKKAVPTYLTLGIVGAVAGGLLWLPWYSVSSAGMKSTPIFVFEFLCFHVFASLFGADIFFLVLHYVRISSQNKEG
jgi:uncharacterized membrane protein YeaQ/YmgE (transglycosylase-associated protein family)